MITCRELIDFLMAYLSGELPGNERAEFELHLGECSSCVEYMKTYRETVALGKACFEEDDQFPADIPEDLVAAILAARRKNLQL